MSLEKAKIADVIYDVITLDQYYQNPALYGQYTAIRGDDGYIYPIRTKTDNRPGFYPTGGFDMFKPPSFGEGLIYSQQNVINFNDATTFREVIQAKQRLVSAERSILTTIDSVFTPEITDKDTPEMIALKTAIIEKHIDLDKYEQRFGPNYNNDKRLLRKNSITFGKMRSICDALDIKVSITLEDAAPDVPNPIGRSISAEVTGNSTFVTEDESEGAVEL